MLNFEVVKTRERKTVVEKYDFPVLVVNPRTDITGGVQKFELNKAAVAQFGFSNEVENFVGLAFDAKNEFVLVNLGNNQAKIMAKVNRDYSFNSRKIYELLCKQFVIFQNEVHEFRLDITTDADSGLKFASMNIIPIAIPEELPEERRISLAPPIEDAVKEDMYFQEAQVIDENFYNNN